MNQTPAPTAETIALDLAYHIRHIERYRKLTEQDASIAVGVSARLTDAVAHLKAARSSLLDGLDRDAIAWLDQEEGQNDHDQDG